MIIYKYRCPTDVTIMGSLGKPGNTAKTLLAPFEAFKFPTSDIVQFKALVTPCLPNCEPVNFLLFLKIDFFFFLVLQFKSMCNQ